MPSNLERKARRERQTRLAFDPIDLDSSSRVRANMSPAKVRYKLPDEQQTTASAALNAYTADEESDDILASDKKGTFTINTPTKRKRTGKLPFKPLPTPANSSQMQIRRAASFDSFEDDEDDIVEIKANRYHSTSRSQDFRNMGSKGAVGGTAGRRPTRSMEEQDDSDGSPPEVEVKTPSKKKRKDIKRAYNPTPSHVRDWDGSSPMKNINEDIATFPRMTSRLRSASKPSRSANEPRQTSATLSNDSDDDVAIVHPRSIQRCNTIKQSKKPILLSSDDDDDDDEPESSWPVATSSQRLRNSLVTDSNESDEDLPILGKASRVSKGTPNKLSMGQFIETEDDSDGIVTTSLAARRRRIAIPTEEDTDEEPISSPFKRRKLGVEMNMAGVETSSPNEKNPAKEQEDDDSDLPSLNSMTLKRKDKSKSKSMAGPTTPSRFTRQSKLRKHRTAKEKTMELLKRKRAGENIDELTESESDEEPQAALYDSDSDSDLQILSEFEDDSEPEEPEKVRKPTRRPDEDHYDSDFVIEDDEGPLGVPHPGLINIPLQFTHAAHKPLKEHFKDAIEWMVHRKINPAFSRDDPIYSQAFKKLDDEYHGYAQSKFVSTQWTQEFTKAIYARPILMERPCENGEGYTLDGVPKCDACNHRRHVPKYAIQFKGKAYHKDTLEEIEQDSTDSEEDDDDSEVGVEQSVNSNGQDLPSEDKEWFCGIVCKTNAEQAHTLIHWKYALNEWVVDQLENEGYLTPNKLAEREKMKAKQRREYANGIVDEWDSNGQIKVLYGDFKRQLETAREAKQGRWGGGNRRG